jgi:hypothetical protein
VIERAYEVELEPEAEPAEDAAVVRAVTELVAADRLGEPGGYRSAWRRAAARELVDDRMGTA